LDRPGHYRALFESWNAEHVDTPLDELPGHELWQSLLGAIAACGVPEDERAELGTLIWAGLHGLVCCAIGAQGEPLPALPPVSHAAREARGRRVP
jgi:hypothetical protein